MRMIKIQISILCFVIGALAAVATTEFQSRAQAGRDYPFTGAEVSLITGTITGIDGASVYLSPNYYDNNPEVPPLRFLVTKDTTYGEVIRYVTGDTIVNSGHYDVEQTDLNTGDVIYMFFDANASGEITAQYIKKVIIENV